ncbi:alpha-hydroxy acid oxidase [Paraburkholderia sp. MM5477-R1]|uniref:alpha-hydroxy acid oxidase n=1 Tax=Paraburkholderia sp. MM5477-R1 TaxID=2991062 RepID=UPI003D1D1666
MRTSQANSISDLKKIARDYLPRIAFDFIEGGVEDEICLRRNHDAFDRYQLLPQCLIDVSQRDQSTDIFGRTYSCPFGIAPTGGAGMWRKGADLMLAQAAAKANVPFILSCASISSVESIVDIAGKNVWFQSYATHDTNISEALIRRAQMSEVETLVVTVDVPVTGKRERNLRNGFSRPLKLRPSIVLDGILHPRWLARYLAAGATMPNMENWTSFVPPNATADEILAFYGSQTPSATQTWAKIAQIRARWNGRLVLKGILNPMDAVKAFEVGADGIIVSNHGGRQLDLAPSPVDVLPLIRAMLGNEKTVMLDSGIQRGTNILKALALGADFTFVGRATLYGVIAGGREGAARALDILKREVDINMGLLGRTSTLDVGQDILMRRNDYAPDPATAITANMPSGDRPAESRTAKEFDSAALRSLGISNGAIST